MVTNQDLIRQKTNLGLILMTGVVFFTKCASLISQVLLGHLLNKSDFGLFAAATAMAVVATSMRDAGTGKFLIQKGDQFSDFYRPAFKLAFIANFLIFVALVSTGISIVSNGGQKAVSGYLMMWIAVSILVSTPAFLGRSLAHFNLSFRWVAKVMAASVVIRYTSMILLAFAGYGPFSFVVPLVITALLESTIFFLYFTRNNPHAVAERSRLEPNTPSVWSVIKHTRWIIFGSLAIALINNGDYLVLSQFLNTTLVGEYFFGFQLTVGVSAIFTQSIQNVLLPTYSRSKDVIDETVVNHLSKLFLISGPLCIFTALAIPLIIKTIWWGKWDNAIPVSQFLLIALSLRLASPVCRAAIESAGQWRLQSFIVWGDAMGTTLTSLLALVAGVRDVATFALLISLYRIAFSLVQIAIFSQLFKLHTATVMGTLSPIAASIGLGATAYVLAFTLKPIWGTLAAEIFAPLLFVLAYGIMNRNQPDYQRMCGLLQKKQVNSDQSS